MRAALDGLQSAGGERIIPESEIRNAQQMKADLDAVDNLIAKVMKPTLENIAAIQQEDLAALITMKEAWASIVEDAGRLLNAATEFRRRFNNLGNSEVFDSLLQLLEAGPEIINAQRP
jgi:hypothetical protein